MRVEADIRNALENHEFVLYYQPIVRLPAATIEAVEALLRWRHPTRGLLGPAEFIAIAESSGLIVPIGAWALRQACREVASWDEAGGRHQLGVHVNVSPAQFVDPDLSGIVEQALAGSGLEPCRLTLEITESLVIDGVDHAVEVLEGLRGLGVRVAIDDFGTGYSSLSSLRDLPVDLLKIDRSFVEGVDSSGSRADLTRRILELAGDFHLRAVAEGVEERGQLEALERMGCDSVQGFYFYKPLPPVELLPVLRAEQVAPAGQ
jgi:EAL domain-containing protein (putative c-di-GMP-specific phosphodiesterase class I)